VLDGDAGAEFLGQLLFQALDVRSREAAGSADRRRRGLQAPHQRLGVAHRQTLLGHSSPTSACWRRCSAQQRRAWPISIVRFSRSSQTSGASSSRRNMLLTPARDGRPHRRLLVRESELVIRRVSARASSSGFRFSRWMFSIRAMAIAASSECGG